MYELNVSLLAIEDYDGRAQIDGNPQGLEVKTVNPHATPFFPLFRYFFRTFYYKG
jgi:hypothetical protein